MVFADVGAEIVDALIIRQTVEVTNTKHRTLAYDARRDEDSVDGSVELGM